MIHISCDVCGAAVPRNEDRSIMKLASNNPNSGLDSPESDFFIMPTTGGEYTKTYELCPTCMMHTVKMMAAAAHRSRKAIDDLYEAMTRLC